MSHMKCTSLLCMWKCTCVCLLVNVDAPPALPEPLCVSAAMVSVCQGEKDGSLLQYSGASCYDRRDYKYWQNCVCVWGGGGGGGGGVGWSKVCVCRDSVDHLLCPVRMCSRGRVIGLSVCLSVQAVRTVKTLLKAYLRIEVSEFSICITHTRDPLERLKKTA